MNSIFEYRDYKAFISDALAARASSARGSRSALAASVDCQTSYVSQVLSGPAHFSLEQGMKVADHLHLTKEEEHFLLLLIQHARAGSDRLQKYFSKAIEEEVHRRLDLKTRFKTQKRTKEEHQAVLYSAWYYVAIHVLLSIPGFQTAESLARKLDLSPGLVRDALRFLVSCGLAKAEGSRFVISEQQTHLGGDSPMIKKHHANWRLQAIRSIERDYDQKNLHYSSAVSLSVQDVAKVKSILVETIEDIKQVVRPSPAEVVYSFNIDLFGI